MSVSHEAESAIALNNEQILVSLVVSTRGRTTTLEVLFDSLVKQTYQNFQVIVVDQNDDDRLDPLFAEGKWPLNLRHIHTPTDRGLSRGRNVGWKNAKGSVILFPDDDCWYPPWFISRALALITATGADFVSGRAADPDGTSINGRFETAAQFINRVNVWTTGIEWTMFFKRSTLETVGGFDPDIGIGASTPWQSCEGQDIVLRALAKGLKGYFDPSLYGHHARFDVDTEASGHGKGRLYGRGLGHILRRHGYGLWSALNWIGRPAIKSVLYLAQGKASVFQYYRNVALGRFEGWSGWLNQ